VFSTSHSLLEVQKDLLGPSKAEPLCDLRTFSERMKTGHSLRGEMDLGRDNGSKKLMCAKK
jgi:hypothetical protein